MVILEMFILKQFRLLYNFTLMACQNYGRVDDDQSRLLHIIHFPSRREDEVPGAFHSRPVELSLLRAAEGPGRQPDLATEHSQQLMIHNK